jgi:hypothetical protein
MHPAVNRRTREESVVMTNHLAVFSTTMQFEEPVPPVPKSYKYSDVTYTLPSDTL